MSDFTLMLVDGTAVAYRAFYAIRDLSTHSGQPTNAVFGFVKMIQQLEQLWNPTHLAVVFDGGLPQERLSVLATYKAQREPMPDSLRGQFEPIEEFLERSDIPSVRIEGQEADDVMATMIERWLPVGRDALMATSDKDLYQLVCERVFMVSPVKMGSKMGPSEVAEKIGVGPQKVVEWLALTGDTVDNIPGVPGIGPKTAAKLLSQFGSLQALYAGLNAVQSDRMRQLLEQHKGIVMRNVGLVELNRKLPMDLRWEEMRVKKPEPDRLRPFFEKMEFKSMAEAMKASKTEKAPEPEKTPKPVNLELDFGDSS